MSISRTGSGMYVSSASYSSSILPTQFASPLIAPDRRAADHRRVVARVVVLAQQLAHFELDEVEQLGVVDEVALVEEHDDLRHVHLAGEQDVLARLRHRAVDRAHHEDRAVHLRGTRDHVLHVVGVARAVDVRVVALRRLVLHVRRRDRQNLRRVTAALRLRRLRDLVVGDVLRAVALVRRDLRERRRQRRLAVVDVADRADVHVRLVPLELCLCHCTNPGWFESEVRMRARDQSSPLPSSRVPFR